MKHPLRKFHDRAKKLLGKEINIPGYVVILVVILLIAFDLRIQSVTHSVIDTPIRGDVGEYLLYGYNLKHYGIYSKSDTLFKKSEIPPKPDATRAPIYGMFVSLFLSEPPQIQNLSRITLAQAVISTVTVLITFLICRMLLPIPFALTATALTAISPHLVAANIYVLSETLLSFMLVLAVYTTAKIVRKKNFAIPALIGLVLAAVALTHPMFLYFIVPATIFLMSYWGWRKGYKKPALLLIGFCVLYGAWTTRNLISIGVTGDNHLMHIVMRTGIYPNLMYQDDPDTFPYPYHFDPNFKETSKDLPSVLAEFIRAFREAPIKQLRWYLVNKPIMLYSWNLVEGSRGYDLAQKGDVFTYGVRSIISSPYDYLPHFRLTHGIMYATHWVWVILMVVGVIIAWLPRKRLGLSEEAVFVVRFISLLLLYHAAIMIAGVPIARYSVAMRPFLYIMAMLPLALAYQRYLSTQASAARRTEPNRRKTNRSSKPGGSGSRRATALRKA